MLKLSLVPVSLFTNNDKINDVHGTEDSTAYKLKLYQIISLDYFHSICHATVLTFGTGETANSMQIH